MFAPMLGKPPVILVVDDLAMNIRILREAVRNLGEVYFATNGSAALNLARQCLPDIVLLDIEMHDMDGYEVCAAFKHDPFLRDASIIFVTSHGEPDFEIRALAYGAVDFIQKPLNIPVARARVQTHVALRNEAFKLAAARGDLETLLNHIPAFIAYWREDLINLYVNKEAAAWFPAALPSNHMFSMQTMLGERSFEAIEAHLQDLGEGGSAHFELQLHAPESGIQFAQVTLVARGGGAAASGFVMLMTDITARKQAESAKLEYLARHDDLTDLANRLMLLENTELALQAARIEHLQVAMLVLDLDHFKIINDESGQATGDRLLWILARRIEDCCRSEDTLSRGGGGAFSILLPGVPSMRMLRDFADQLLKIVSEPIWLDDGWYYLSASVGVGVFPDDSSDGQTLWRHAESAMYEAKEQGRGRWRFFHAQLDDLLRKRHQLERALREALENETLEVYYQAKVDPSCQRIRGVEALVRWSRAPGGPVSPAEFIPMAEAAGLIWMLGRWVLLRACNDARCWQDRGQPVCVSVNISVLQFREDHFLSLIADVLIEADLRPELLELEITEGILLKDTQQMLDKLLDLQSMGVRIAIDDFGTGYSSLAYLKHFPINVLKIDQSFVRGMLEHPADLAIIKAIILIGQSLGLDLVAEGVETSEQAMILLSLGCPSMQGFLYSRPSPFEVMSDVLSAWPSMR
ncbi:EAL domain-containing protein [Pseudomonas sp. MWU16-30317]|uniref:putative bifunctional diguanylate cyclase/phosphodiesterase n=1 Tax=Pseudomonas sp. MWU16-30317 TaxID=2878095 RepID=UPI001CFA0689|nr:EAL domain-containing protein [Pseudomonas sp. MWU16-30317]